MRNIWTTLTALLLLSSLSARAGRFTLFADEVKTEYPSILYDFLERYLFELDSLQRKDGTLGTRLVDDKVIFVTGSPSTARGLTMENAFAISRTGNKFYEVVWSDTLGNELLHIAFPASFELILGMPKNKIEKTLHGHLSTKPSTFAPNTLPPNQRLEQTDDGYFVSVPKEFLGVEELNMCKYYSKEDDDEYEPVFSPSQNVYSAKNLLQGMIADCNNYKMYIFQNLYDFKTDEYTLNLSQWLNYCRDIHADVYVAMEEEREDGVMMLLVAQCGDLGFQHALSLVLPWNFTEKRDCMLKGKLNAFIPIHNVKALYQEQLNESKKDKKGQTWQIN